MLFLVGMNPNVQVKSANLMYFSFQCPLAESPCLCNARLCDPSSFDAPHLFRAFDDNTRSVQNVITDRISERINIVVVQSRYWRWWWWTGRVRLGSRLQGRALFGYRKHVPHRTPDLLHLRDNTVLQAERCARVPAYECRTHACRVRRHDRPPERKVIVQQRDVRRRQRERTTPMILSLVIGGKR